MPPKRACRWLEGEVVRLVKAAWRNDNRGLACIIAVCWDSQLSPGDVRTLTDHHRRPHGRTSLFTTHRGKTGAAAIGTLSPRTHRLLDVYLADLRERGVMSQKASH